tara:strand:- start:8542 stop:9465 length:924 start_codon:yes stop_codon:yes gene_type:complete
MPNELLIRVVLHGGVVPGVAAFAVLGLLWWRFARRPAAAKAEGPDTPPARGPRWAAPLLLALGFGVSFWVVEQSIELWPVANTRRLYHAALLVGLVGVVEGATRLPWIVRAVVRGAAFAGVAWMLTEGYSPNVLTPAELWLLVAGAGVVGSAVVAFADAGLSRTTGWTGPLAALALIGPLQPFLHLAGYSSGSIALTGVVAVLSSALLIALAFRSLTLGSGTATVLVGLVLISLLGAGVQTEPKSIPALLLVAAAPLALGLRAGGPLTTLVLRGTLVSLGMGAAIGLVVMPGAEASEPDPYADYYSD